MSLFNAKTQQEETDALAQYLPSDKIFNSKSFDGSNLRKLLTALGGELSRIDQLFQNVMDGLNLLTTTDLDYIRLWEGAVGIPDESFPDTESLGIEARRTHILIKMRSLGVLTEQDFVDLALLLGYVISIENGTLYGVFPLSFPIAFAPSIKTARFLMVINAPASLTGAYSFPIAFPVIFSTGNNIISSLFNILKPANTRILFNYTL